MRSIFAIFIFAPLLLYLMPVIRGLRYEKRADHFFFAQQQISSTAFANGSVAYGFQIASVSVFFGWGFEYGLGALVNPFFWGVGILWFVSWLPKYAFFLGRAQTLHGFLGEAYETRALTKLTALMTVVGLFGAITAELAWGSTIVTMISANSYFVAGVTAFMAFCALFYVVWAGQESIILADQYRLAVAHVGFASLLFFLVTLLHWRGSDAHYAGASLSFAMTTLFGVVAWATTRQLRNSVGEAEPDALSIRCTKFIRGFMLFGTFGALINLAMFLVKSNGSSAPLQASSLVSFEQGTLNLLSLALLPLCWQFIDFTMWQRLGGVRVESDADLRRIRFSLIRYALETPVSWIFALVAGIALKHGAIPISSDAIQTGISSIPIAISQANTPLGEAVDAVVVGIFGAGVVAAMLSTVDTFVIGATSAFVYDLTSWTGQAKSSGQNPNSSAIDTAVAGGKFVATGLIIIALASYWFATYFSFDLVSLLFGAYSAQLSLLPAVLGALYLTRDDRPNGYYAITSVMAGFAGGVAATIYALNNSSWSLYPPLFSLGIATAVYGISWALTGRLRSKLS
jgi:hypothetical protein